MLQKLIILRVIGRIFLKVLENMKRSGAVFSASMLWLSHLVCEFINLLCRSSEAAADQASDYGKKDRHFA